MRQGFTLLDGLSTNEVHQVIGSSVVGDRGHPRRQFSDRQPWAGLLLGRGSAQRVKRAANRDRIVPRDSAGAHCLDECAQYVELEHRGQRQQRLVVLARQHLTLTIRWSGDEVSERPHLLEPYGGITVGVGSAGGHESSQTCHNSKRSISRPAIW